MRPVKGIWKLLKKNIPFTTTTNTLEKIRDEGAQILFGADVPAAGPPDVGLAQPLLLAGLHPGVRAAGGEELGQLDLVPLPLAEAPGGLLVVEMMGNSVGTYV